MTTVVSQKGNKRNVINRKSRLFVLQRNYYYDTHDDKGNVVDTSTYEEWYNEIKKEWQAIQGVEFCAVITHDKDVKPDGTPVTPHIHAIVRFTNPRSEQSVRSEFNISGLSNGEPVKDKRNCALYMVHMTADAASKGKAFYDFSDIDVWVGSMDVYRDMLADKGGSNAKAKNDEEDTTLVDELSEQVRLGEITATQAELALVENGDSALLRKYRKVFGEEYKLFMASIADKVNKGIYERDLMTVYIEGAGGSGKSLLADELGKLYCNDLGIHYTSASGRSTTYDFAGMYQGQHVTICNELGSSELSVRQFLSLFDPHRVAPVSSRNFDKVWFANYCFVTNTEVIEKWIGNLVYYSGRQYQDTSIPGRLKHNVETHDLLRQVRRRIKFTIRYGKDNFGKPCVELYKVNANYTGYDLLGIVGYTSICDDVKQVAIEIKKVFEKNK